MPCVVQQALRGCKGRQKSVGDATQYNVMETMGVVGR